MHNHRGLHNTLQRIDGSGYGAYKQILGSYEMEGFRLKVDRVQVDPFAPPSLMRVILTPEEVNLPAELTSDARGRTAAADFLTRRFAEAITHHQDGSGGSGKGGVVSIGAPGQQVLERTSVLIAEDRIEARIMVGLPAAGRRVRGHHAARILTEQLPRIVDASMRYANLDHRALADHVRLYRDQEHLRDGLAAAGLVAFIGESAVLPRRSGDSDLPMESSPVPFAAPESLRVSFDLPSGTRVTGMGLPRGVTVIVGGGYHGKSTLLRALERGVYAHISGDGREWVITDYNAVSIRAEDGRAVTGVDISPFISGLPSGVDTAEFSSTNASGSTSQAANLVEAVEAGASAVLIDEDTSATNFMIRDERMRRLIAADREPITPFIDRVRPLLTEQGVSTILVAGGSGAFFDVADLVIAMDAYVPGDVTETARAIADDDANQHQRNRTSSGEQVFGRRRPRIPAAQALAKRGKAKPATARGRDLIQYGRERVDLTAVAQLVDPAQANAVAHALDRLAERVNGRISAADAVQELLEQMDLEGLDVVSAHSGHPGHLARPRRHEILAALNRYRGLSLG